MMVDKEELGLSLSLNFPATTNRTPVQLNRMPSAVSSSSSPHFAPHKASWNDIFPSLDRTSEALRVETRSFLKGIDVNRPPATAECEDEAGVSSPNSTISSQSGKRSERETITIDENENENERSSSRGISDEEDGDNSRKKLRLSKDQSAVLEESFKEHNTLNPKQKLALAKKLGLRPRQVEVWFQNRRARTKLKQTEVDCEFLKRRCENLTEENRRLQKEVQELRALKLSPQFYMQMAPPTTLTMCPSCERVAAPPSSASAATSSADRSWPHPMVAGSTTHHHRRRPVPVNPWAAQATAISLRQRDRNIFLGLRV